MDLCFEIGSTKGPQLQAGAIGGPRLWSSSCDTLNETCGRHNDVQQGYIRSHQVSGVPEQLNRLRELSDVEDDLSTINVAFKVP